MSYLCQSRVFWTISIVCCSERRARIGQRNVAYAAHSYSQGEWAGVLNFKGEFTIPFRLCLVWQFPENDCQNCRNGNSFCQKLWKCPLSAVFGEVGGRQPKCGLSPHIKHQTRNKNLGLLLQPNFRSFTERLFEIRIGLPGQY